MKEELPEFQKGLLDSGIVGDEDESLFYCVYCGNRDSDCPHFFGSRDLHFTRDFEVDTIESPLGELQEDFRVLGEAVGIFLDGPIFKQIKTLKPARLRKLVESVSQGEINRGFSGYLERLCKDTRIPTRVHFINEEGGPGYSSTVQVFWVRDPKLAVVGVKKRVGMDIRKLAISK